MFRGLGGLGFGGEFRVGEEVQCYQDPHEFIGCVKIAVHRALRDTLVIKASQHQD